MPNSALEPKVEYTVVEYDFEKDGGDVGDIELRGGDIPSGCVTKEGALMVEDALTSGGASTVALRVASAEDTLAATAIGSLGAGDVVDTVKNAESGATRQKVIATIGAAALTGGKFKAAIPYLRLA